jgi:hypothetical protein
MTLFLPRPLKNPLNGSWGNHFKHARIARTWRELTASCMLVEWIHAGRPPRTPQAPKTITFTAHVGAKWDDDNLPAAIKPIRDGLVDAAVIHSDAPDAGHTFVYRQVVDRKRRGVEIAIVPSSALVPISTDVP